MPPVSHRLPPSRVVAQPELLEVTALNEHSWQVCDSRREPTDAMRLLAFIERRRDSYRITWLAGGRGWAIFRDFDAALRSVRIRCLDQSLDD
jgi:hypothetical protein